LTQPYYKAKVVFEDKAKGTVEKNIPVNDPATNQPADVVYRIKNKDGEMKIRYYSAQPVQPNYVPPADVFVVHYHQPAGTTNTETTTTTTTNETNTGNGSVNFNTGGGGVSIGVNAGDPNTNGGTTRTTTTTTTTSRSSTTTSMGYGAQPPSNNGCQYAMDPGSFKTAKQTIGNSNFDETKLSTAKGILASNCLNADQVVQVCQLFGFEETKLKFAKFAYSKTVDPGNYFKVGNVFSFDASKDDLNNFISNGGR
jgi:hypothetical protein